MHARPDIDGAVEAQTVTDDALWERMRLDDAEAYALLFERHARAIYNYCFRRTADWALAEDLTSVVFLEAWRRRTQELQPGKVLPWLYGVATNVVRNRRRASRRYAAALARVPAPEQTADFADDVLERVDDEAAMGDVLRALAKLPRRQRDVLALCGWSGLSYEEAAAALGIPVGTVKSSLFRARERLRELSGAGGHGRSATPSDEECPSDV